MEKQTKIQFTFLLSGTLLFDFLFWKESSGINTLIFDAFILLSARIVGYRLRYSFLSMFFTICLFASAIAIIMHSSAFAIIMHYLTFVLIIGLIHQKQADSVLFNILASLESLLRFPQVLYGKFPKNERKRFGKILKFIKLSLIPVLILWAFYIIYKIANPVFDSLAIRFFNWIINHVSPYFKNISILHIGFILFGFAITSWVLFKTNLSHILQRQSGMSDHLNRTRKNLNYKYRLNKGIVKESIFYGNKPAISLKLKSEFISALVLLILINLLLLIVNLVDVNWVWFGFEYSESFDMKQFVHEGTYLLIISILMSMGIMLYFFRGNLNFYSKAKSIKYLTYIWIGQNLILAISVAILNFRYIEYWGLAYRRIGVILFLLAVVYGLYSLFIKIRFAKSTYFLTKRNAFSVYIILLIASMFNWDSIIAQHNLGHPFKNHMETSYLLSLSDKILPMIGTEKQVLEQNKKYNTYADFSPYSYQQYYNLKVKRFLKNYNHRSWKSWNYAEWRAYKFYSDEYFKYNNEEK
jgi:hypothetical protein